MAGLAQEAVVAVPEEVTALPIEEMQKLWEMEVPMWQITDEEGGKRLQRVYEVPDYTECLNLTSSIGRIAESNNHHPVMIVRYKTVTVIWHTEAINSLHRNDFLMAAKTDELFLAAIDALRKKDPVQEASEQSFPGSDSPGWHGDTKEKESDAEQQL